MGKKFGHVGEKLGYMGEKLGHMGKKLGHIGEKFSGLFLISELILNMVDYNCFSDLCAIYLSTIDNLQFFLAFLSSAYFFQNHFSKLFQKYHQSV